MTLEYSFLVRYDESKTGIFKDLNRSILYILSNPFFNLEQLDKWKIKSIYHNSFFIKNKYYLSIKQNKLVLHRNNSILDHHLIEQFNSTLEVNQIDEDDETQTDSVNSEEIEEIQNLITETNDIQYKLNLLKKDKEKLEEKKNVFLIDKDLYFKFKNSLETDDEFTVPEIFLNKYKLFRTLEEEDNLTWEEFNKRYVPENMDTSYNSLFFNEQFLDNKPSSSDSDSESSTD